MPDNRRRIRIDREKKIDRTMPGRTRPRNPNEWKWLKKWEYERGGKKIGDIGPPPPGLEDFDPATWDPDVD